MTTEKIIAELMVDAINEGKEQRRKILAAEEQGINTDLVLKYSIEDLIHAIEIIMDEDDMILICQKEDFTKEQKAWLANIIGAHIDE